MAWAVELRRQLIVQNRGKSDSVWNDSVRGRHENKETILRVD